MNYLIHDRAVQGVALMAGVIIVFLMIVWATGQLRERYVDRYNLLILKITTAQSYVHLVHLEEEIDIFYEEFYPRNPQKVAEMTIGLNNLLNKQYSAITGGRIISRN